MDSRSTLPARLKGTDIPLRVNSRYVSDGKLVPGDVMVRGLSDDDSSTTWLATRFIELIPEPFYAAAGPTLSGGKRWSVRYEGHFRRGDVRGSVDAYIFPRIADSGISPQEVAEHLAEWLNNRVSEGS